MEEGELSETELVSIVSWDFLSFESEVLKDLDEEAKKDEELVRAPGSREKRIFRSPSRQS